MQFFTAIYLYENCGENFKVEAGPERGFCLHKPKPLQIAKKLAMQEEFFHRNIPMWKLR
jgi:hypothetical protein